MVLYSFTLGFSKHITLLLFVLGMEVGVRWHSSAVKAGATTFDTSTQPPQTEMLRMVVAPFESCRKMHSLKTLRHDYQTAPREVMMA
jgi:hypothetical protein